MDTNKYISLVYKQLKGTINSDEAKDLSNWENQSAANRNEADGTRRAWRQSQKHDLPFELDLNSDFAKVQSKIKAQQSDAKIVEMPKRRRWLSIAAAAAILVIAGFWAKSFLGGQEEWKNLAATNSIEEILLEDGTKIWLNAGSSLSYPENFASEERPVKLKGEAYFEVTKDAKKPFRVYTDATTVTVLGTAFNVRNIEGENISEIAVSEGKVQVVENKTQQKVILSINEKAVYNRLENTLVESKDENLNALAWKRKRMNFNNVSLQKAIASIERHYNIRIDMKGLTSENCMVGGSLKTNMNANKFLTELVAPLKIKVKKGKTQNEYQLIGGVCE